MAGDPGLTVSLTNVILSCLAHEHFPSAITDSPAGTIAFSIIRPSFSVYTCSRTDIANLVVTVPPAGQIGPGLHQRYLAIAFRRQDHWNVHSRTSDGFVFMANASSTLPSLINLVDPAGYYAFRRQSILSRARSTPSVQVQFHIHSHGCDAGFAGLFSHTNCWWSRCQRHCAAPAAAGGCAEQRLERGARVAPATSSNSVSPPRVL